MQVVIEKDPVAFLNKYETWLRRKTLENSLILGVLRGCKIGIYKNPLFFIVVENEKTLLLSMRTPSKNLIISGDGSKETFEALARFLVKEGIEIPWAIGSSGKVKGFLDFYGGLTNKEFVFDKKTNIYSLTKVIMPENIEGKLVLATQDDLEFLAKCKYDFNRDILPEEHHLTMEEARDKKAKNINEKNVAVWKVNGENVAEIVFDNLEYMSHIRDVYTLPEFRKRGYASAMTAKISQMLLDKGCDSVCLFADADDSTSNGVYQRIGFNHVTNSAAYVLKD